MATQQEIQDLKHDWWADPIWDLEETEGFEDHREELLAYRLECEAAWSKRSDERLAAKMAEMGLSDNLALAQYIMRLEQRIEALEEGVTRIEEK